ncbi:MAG: hypothetical protein U9R25_09700 [Chloroflexota bacterium]|nr:hypothetical protein [Chloroflexota bacterium]
MTGMMQGDCSFVGFGFGAIQAGLFLYEAQRAGNFSRMVVAEVLPDVVAAVRSNGGQYRVNIAHDDGIERAQVGPVTLLDPGQEQDRERLVEALAQAHEIATAIPSVAYYRTPDRASLHRSLADGLRLKAKRGGPRAVVYAAENHNEAAEILQGALFSQIPAQERQAVNERVQFVNTVIGKMSGVVDDPRQIEMQALAPITPGHGRAFLVEAFNRILISRISFDDESFSRGIQVFEEKGDLLPFEEAKLYGHNATHALAAYLGAVRGVEAIADLQGVPGVMPFLRSAFLQESGAALIRKYRGVDPLFTVEGYRHYAEDLLTRMANPYLQDRVARVGRDPQRKLGWDDRLIGTIRLAMAQGLEARRYALGAAAALITLDEAALATSLPASEWLLPLWQKAGAVAEDQTAVIEQIEAVRPILAHWIAEGFPDLESLWDRYELD